MSAAASANDARIPKRAVNRREECIVLCLRAAQVLQIKIVILIVCREWILCKFNGEILPIAKVLRKLDACFRAAAAPLVFGSDSCPATPFLSTLTRSSRSNKLVRDSHGRCLGSKMTATRSCSGIFGVGRGGRIFAGVDTVNAPTPGISVHPKGLTHCHRFFHFQSEAAKIPLSNVQSGCIVVSTSS